MKSKNHVSIIGRIGSDVELRKTDGGVSYARISVATSEGGYKRADGTEIPEVTQWHNVVLWRQLAELVAKYCRKGQLIAIDGKLVYNKYQKQGVECMSANVVADDVVLLEKDTKPEQAQPQRQQPQSVIAFPPVVDDNILPF